MRRSQRQSCAVCQLAAKGLTVIALFPGMTAAITAGEDAPAKQESSGRIRSKELFVVQYAAMYRQELHRAVAANVDRDAQVFINGYTAADERSQLLGLAFDEVMFGTAGPEGADAARRQLDAELHLRLAMIKWLCGLSDTQQRQLELAGRGDIKRYFDRADEQRRQFSTSELRDGTVIRNVSREMAELRDLMMSGLHDEDSRFGRLLVKGLTPEQAGRIQVIRDVKQAGGTIQSQYDGNSTINEIRLSGRTFTDTELARLNGVSDLHRLALDGTQITDRGLACLRGMKHLKYLDLARTKIGDDGLANIHGLTELQDLDLTGTGATDAGLEHLRDLVNLRRLYLYGTQITDAGLINLKSLQRLQTLHLGQTRITDAGLASLNLTAMESLEDLRLDGTAVGDASLTHFDALKNLQTLDLRMTRVSDIGMAQFAGMKQLKLLYLYHTHVTDAGIASLKASLPALKVVP